MFPSPYGAIEFQIIEASEYIFKMIDVSVPLRGYRIPNEVETELIILK